MLLCCIYISFVAILIRDKYYFLLAYEIWFYLLLITSIKILLLLYISWDFPYTTKQLKYVVDRGILWKLEVALCQQKSAQAWCRTYDVLYKSSFTCP
jgi:hypothetical protein